MSKYTGWPAFFTVLLVMVRWLTMRLGPSALKRRDVLERLYVLFEPLDSGPRSIVVSGRKVLFETLRRMVEIAPGRTPPALASSGGKILAGIMKSLHSP